MSDEHIEAPSTIGPYRLGELLGEGGMGSVYRAVQVEPVQREVALKIIKPGMDTKEVVARFESERQALAVMDHSGIAKVLDAGATLEGRPYFVMELVRGVPITEYCDRHKLQTRARIELFAKVCDAVQHAHQKGVIHRDLKPSNVLVSVEDAKPAPRIIDFGIAKAVGSTLTEKTLVTRLGQILGTPAYMSPEQAERDGLDVDTRTDLYSLGVMLYELLSGSLPFDRDALHKPDFVVQYLLREQAVPTPSARLSSLAETQETVARNRETDVRTLRRELRGDLDWIVMKAMEKDRTRRYGTAAELAQDLRRFLLGETVTARPPTTGYRLGKFARRNRGAIAAAVAVLVTLAGGAAVSTVGFVRAERSALEARTAAARAEAVAGFLDRMIRSASPVTGEGGQTTLREVLDAASEEVSGGVLSEEPMVEAAVRRSIGASYLHLGVLDRAGEHFEAAIALLNESSVATPYDRVGALRELGQLRRQQGEYAAAEQRYRRALALADSAGLDEDGGAGEVLVNGVRNDLGLALQRLDRIDEAAEVLEALAASERRLKAPDDLDLATTLNNLALVKRTQGDVEGAIGLFEETLEVLRAAVGPSHVYVAAVMESIGSLEQRMGRYETADSLMRAALDMREAVLGPEHPDVANGLHGLGLLHVESGELELAAEYLDRALEQHLALLGEDHSRTGAVFNSIGLLHLRRQDPLAAETAFRRSIAIRSAALGERHRTTLNTTANLAAALVQSDRAADAEAIARQVAGIAEQVGFDDAVQVGALYRTWGQALTALGRFEEAEGRLKRSYGMQEPELGPDHIHTQRTISAFVGLYDAWERPDDRVTWEARLVGGT